MNTHVAPDRIALGRSAAAAIAGHLREVLSAQPRATVVFAAAPSQNETLAELAAQPGIDWTRVTAFHLDEYAGARAEDTYSFRNYLRRRIRAAVFHEIQGEAPDQEAECARYAAHLPPEGFDIALLGIGENGHLAFNDPPCDFSDSKPIRW